MVVQHGVGDERAIRNASSPGRPDRSMRASGLGTTLCPHCEYNPASPRILGYCSWDCHDADADSDGEEGPAAA
jgi:hypothetical protein